MTRLRPALLVAVLGSTGFGGLLALEHVSNAASAPTPTVVNTVQQANQSDAAHVRHCTDAKGQDFQKNKHCRGVSGAQ
jgi:hypothetical protein